LTSIGDRTLVADLNRHPSFLNHFIIVFLNILAQLHSSPNAYFGGLGNN
jgi:hypothetical protein